MRHAQKRCIAIAVLGIVFGVGAEAQGSYIPVYGGPTYDGSIQTGMMYSYGVAVNDDGTALGQAIKYVGGVDLGGRAVLWDASGTTATELGNLGTDASGYTHSVARAINAAGTAVGQAIKYVGADSLGRRTVRWDASGTAATELGNLGMDASGYTYCDAEAINDAGTAVGMAEKYGGGSFLGQPAVLWEGSGTAATELGSLGTNASGFSDANALAINAGGTAVGNAQKFVGGDSLGYRAVRWDSSGTAATELGNLGTDASGYTFCEAGAINAAGTAVGWAYKYVGGVAQGRHAVYWGLNGVAVDLNDLIDPASGWVFCGTEAISDTGWITGDGMFDPDGSGPLAAYQRGFLIQVPEPATLSLLTLGGLWALRRRR